jgi:hypothetical protein
MDDFFQPNKTAGLPYEEILRLAGGTGLDPLDPQASATRATATQIVQDRDRKFSVKPEHSIWPSFAGEAVKAPAMLLSEAAQKRFRPLWYAIDATFNTIGSNSATGAGSDSYGRVVKRNGKLEQKSPEGTDAGSAATNLIESIISAAQWSKVGAIPASLLAGELTEMQIHDANRTKSPYLRDISKLSGYSGEDSQYNTLLNAIESMRVMNTAPQEPGKMSAPLWEGIRNDLKAYVDKGIESASSDLQSGDEARISSAAKRIAALAELMDRTNYDLEAVQNDTQEWTWPFARFGEFFMDEITPYIAAGAGPGYMGFGVPKSGFKTPQQIRSELTNTRPQGVDLLRELNARAMKATGGVDSREWSAKRQKDIADNAAIDIPGFVPY